MEGVEEAERRLKGFDEGSGGVKLSAMDNGLQKEKEMGENRVKMGGRYHEIRCDRNMRNEWRWGECRRVGVEES